MAPDQLPTYLRLYKIHTYQGNLDEALAIARAGVAEAGRQTGLDPDWRLWEAHRTTPDGRKIEVINGSVCVDGKPVADSLTEVKVHPNKEAILFALPNAAFMAGPVVLTAEEASVVRGVLEAAKPGLNDRVKIEERFRKSWNRRAFEAGIE